MSLPALVRLAFVAEGAYSPTSGEAVLRVVAVLLVTLGLGFAVSRVRKVAVGRCLAWLLVVLAVVAVDRVSANGPAGFRMLAIAGALLYGMKAVVSVEAAAGGLVLPPTRWLGFAAGWPGMRPAPFARAFGPPLAGAGNLLWLGLRRAAAGFGFVLLAGLAWRLGDFFGWHQAVGRLVVTPPLLAGLSLMLHFGLFNVLAGAWRLAGVDARPLFRAPLGATSLADFWGRRWNLAFSEMTAVAVFRP